MRNTVGFIILIIVCIALGVTLIVRNNQATKQKHQDDAAKLELSNHWQEVQVKLSDTEQVNRTLENDLKSRKQDISKRIEWIRQGPFSAGETKGAQQLMQNLNAPLSKTKTNYDLNVEINADGSMKVIPPLKDTNAPVFQSVPPK